ncbi:MAG TPA: TetR/AcrR family transcriptional regulator [Aquabacterium sp.]|uniref:TetR/AcrR family transcriptional regulator n=1 Tax=Aquabacterium sp. TaxID=1872578 RepID=UPI002E2FD20C|nr:TetR/AcrR family transcriptional regulator [Aquabacterium sp.]HEX5374401.1 TetR/AcrR family transcriptional regulator [Aquabacterium sp.]
MSHLPHDPTGGDRSRGYHHGNLKVSLIEAGLEALTHVEADDLSLRQLAKEVGVSANAAYRHFEDKDALLSAMAAEGFRRFARAQHDAVAQEPQAEGRLKAAGRAYVAFAQAHPALYRLMFQRLSCVATDPDLAQSAIGAMTVLLEATSSTLHAPAHDERVRVAAAACWSLVHGLSALSQGGQLAVFGLPMNELIDRVLAMPSLLSQVQPVQG